MAKKKQERPASPKNAAPMDKNQKKRKQMSWKERLLSIGAVVAGIAAIILMVLYIPYISQDGEQISLMQKFRNWTPLIDIDGSLASNTISHELKSEVDSGMDDGLDLKQIVEGQFTVLFLGFDESRSNSDVMMLAMFDVAGNKVEVLQIPRDCFVPEYTSFAAGKINSVYTLGDESKEKIQRVVDCVSETLSIPIDRYVTTGCADIASIVDIMGGVEIDMPYTINYEAGKTVYAGQQTLTGQKAEWVLRYRHGYNEGDLGRMQAQRIFIAAAMKKVSDTGTIPMMGYMKKIYDQKLIGTDMSLDEMSKLSDFAIAVGMDNISMYMLPGEGYSYLPDGYKKPYSVYSIHEQTLITLLNEHFRPYLEAVNDLPIKELVTADKYKSTAYDDNNTDLQNIIDGDTFSGK